MLTTMQKLKIGDVLYGCSRRNPTSRIVIERLTKTMAIGECGTRIKLAGNEPFDRVGDSGSFSHTLYYFQTPELDEKWERSEAIAAINYFQRSITPETPLAQLRAIKQIIEQQ